MPYKRVEVIGSLSVYVPGQNRLWTGREPMCCLEGTIRCGARFGGSLALLMRKDPIDPSSSLPAQVGHSRDTTSAVVSDLGMLAVERPLWTLTVGAS
jgi:hypothetical protein